MFIVSVLSYRLCRSHGTIIEMINQSVIMSRILFITILVPTITADFLIFATPNALGQQVMSDRIDKGSGRSVRGIAVNTI